MSQISTPATEAGQAVYSPWVLRIYDLWVLGLCNNFLWCCPSSEILKMYNRCVSEDHLDIGVGSGYFLDRAEFPAQARITLFDLNNNSLMYAGSRIAKYKPQLHRGDVLRPLELKQEYRSVGLNYLFHCLPGEMSQKAIVFDHVRAVTLPGGRIFGSTILQGDLPRNWAAQRLMDIYNKKGIFSNEKDDLATLDRELSRRFSKYKIETRGCVALFEAEV